MCAGAVSRSDACASGTTPPASACSTSSSAASRRVQRFGVVVSAITPCLRVARCDRWGYRHARTRVRAQPPEHAPVVAEGISALRRLDNLNHRPEPWVPHDAPERLRSDRPFADPLMAIEMRPGRALGVVEMQALEMLEPDLPIELLPHVLQRL